MPLDAVKWAKAAEGPTRGRVPAKVSQVLEVGDVVYVEPLNKEANTWRLRQVPEVSGAIVAMDPWTGRVLAMVGGFSFDQSQFNRATQAMRQPGSSFKPFVYAAALDNGYTPSTVVMDAPIEIDQGPGVPPWRPENYSTGKYYGPSTLRTGIELSRNTMTVRLAQDVGMPLIAEYARRFGVYDNLPTYPVVFARRRRDHGAAHGRRLFDVRQRRPAHRADLHRPHPGPLRPHRLQARLAASAAAATPSNGTNQPEPTLVDKREQVIDPMTAYQITSMMEGVVQRGTATVLKQVGKPIAGKTGTTNDEKDVWFVGFSPDIAVGVYLGYDKPRQIGGRATGGGVAAPIVAAFLKEALKDKPAVPFRVPAGIKLIRIDARSGMRLAGGEGRAILEAFKPGTAPPDSYSVIGYTQDAGNNPGQGYGPPGGEPGYIAPQQNRQIRSGPGGLY